jgi:hypothetical protein
MNTDNLLLQFFCGTLVLGLVSLGFQIHVSSRLRKEGQQIGIPLGKSSWIRPFVMGWKYADQLGILTVMAIWSLALGFALIGVFATAYLLIGP